MKTRHIVAICLTFLGFVALPAVTLAQQKTAKECTAKWRANKAANREAGKTEKAYVAECRHAAAQKAPEARKAPTASKAPTTTATAPASAPAPTTAAPMRPIPVKPARNAAPTTPTGANEFSTEAEAKARCPIDTVVWANTRSKIYHFSGHKDYGNTKVGAYMCEKDTAMAAFRASKGEKHP